MPTSRGAGYPAPALATPSTRPRTGCCAPSDEAQSNIVPVSRGSGVERHARDGAALYLVSAVKLHSISLYSRTNPGPPGALVAADQARYVSYAGVALVAAGACVGVVAAGLHARRRAAG